MDDVHGTGKRGQVVNVAGGHARNYLFPRKLAIEASKSNLDNLEKKLKSEEHRRDKEKGAAQDIADKLKDVSVTIPVRVGEGGKLFGSVSGKEIAEALLSQAGQTVDKKKIVLNENIKAVGNYTATIKLNQQVTAEVAVEVVPQEAPNK